jgi:hypothetical protein
MEDTTDSPRALSASDLFGGDIVWAMIQMSQGREVRRAAWKDHILPLHLEEGEVCIGDFCWAYTQEDLLAKDYALQPNA